MLAMRPGGGLVTPEWRDRCNQIGRDLQAYLMRYRLCSLAFREILLARMVGHHRFTLASLDFASAEQVWVGTGLALGAVFLGDLVRRRWRKR